MHRRRDNLSSLIVFVLILFNIFIWYRIFADTPSRGETYFLDVGQGDSELVVLPGGAKILIDAGPASGRAAYSLKSVVSEFDRYIDLAVITHPQLDHFGGFLDLLDRYEFGGFIFNGRSNEPEAGAEWGALVSKIKQRGIPLITLAADDAIIYGESRVNILSPSREFLQSAELNDTGLVMLLKTPSLKYLFTADIGAGVEEYLANNFDLRADVLKIPHHGSRYSAGDGFLKKINPKIAIAEVGEGNSYGHPAKEVLGRLGELGSKIFRTDKNGTIKVVSSGSMLSVFTNK